ncbi:MAG: PhoU domain-containing protein [Desulfurococcaceae archaeon]
MNILIGVEKRRVQKTGSSSYVITLPKEWVDSVELKSGDYVIVEKYGDKLVITPPKARPLTLKATIRVHTGVDLQQVLRMLLAAYLAGYNLISVTFNKSIPNITKLVSELKSTARAKLAGIEVVEESFDTVVFKVLIDMRELPLLNAIRRLHLIVDNMMQDCLILFETGDLNYAHAVIQRDDEADRFHHMIVRELSLALLDVKTQHELGILNTTEVLSYRIIARNLERIADHVATVARRILEVGGLRNYDLIREIFDRDRKLLNKAMEALYNLSRRGAEEVISESRKIVYEVEEALRNKVMPLHIDVREKVVITLILDSLKRIARYSNGVAEATLNIKAAKSPELDIK